MTNQPGGPVNTFIEVFCKACNDVFSRSLASEWQFQAVEEPAAEADEKLISLEVAQSNGDAKIAVELRPEDASKIIEKILGEPVPAGEEINEDQAQIVQSVLDESCAAALSNPLWELGHEFGGTLAKAEWEPASAFAVSGTDGESGTIVLRVLINSETLGAITAGAAKSQAAPASKAAATAPAPATPQTAPSARPSSLDPTAEENLGLVMDVELDLTLCFGRRQMSLKDILHLGPGSVVELDREVQEPVDLLLGDKVVARGEVVIVDGNYGLRVTEICSPAVTS